MKRKKEKGKISKINKKGVLDFFYIMVILFVSIVTLLVSLYITQTIDDMGLFNEYDEAQESINWTKTALMGFDSAIFLIIIGFSIFVIASSYFVWSHPAFFFLGLIILCIAVIVGSIESNIYEDLRTTDQLAATAANYPKANFIMANLPIYIAVMGTLALVIGYMGYRDR